MVRTVPLNHQVLHMLTGHMIIRFLQIPVWVIYRPLPMIQEIKALIMTGLVLVLVIGRFYVLRDMSSFRQARKEDLTMWALCWTALQEIILESLILTGSSRI